MSDYVYDTFTGSGLTPVDSHTGEVGATWTTDPIFGAGAALPAFFVTDGVLRRPSWGERPDSSYGEMRCSPSGSATLPTDNLFIEIGYKLAGLSNTAFTLFDSRLGGDGSYYETLVNIEGYSGGDIYARLNPGEYSGTVVVAPANNVVGLSRVLRLEYASGQLSVLVDGVTVATGTPPPVVGKLYLDIFDSNGDSFFQIEHFRVGDLAGPPPADRELIAPPLKPVGFGTPSVTVETPYELVPQPLKPVRFGTPGPWGMAATPQPLKPVRFGVPQIKSGVDVELPARSLRAGRLGQPMVVPGMPPSDTARQAQSLMPVRFGLPSVQLAPVALAVAALKPARLGAASLSLGLWPASLKPARLGAASLSLALLPPVFKPARLGKPMLAQAFGAKSLKPARLGMPRVVLEGMALEAAGLQPVRLGIPGPVGMVLSPRPLCPARLGLPSVDRGTTC